MPVSLSKRLLDIINALPLKDGMRVLEVGCGPGAMAREMALRLPNGYVLAIDRSAKAIQQAKSGTRQGKRNDNLEFRQANIESFELKPGEKPFDIAVAIRVGALDGRHPEIEKMALAQIAKALTKKGRLFIDGGEPLKEIKFAQV